MTVKRSMKIALVGVVLLALLSLFATVALAAGDTGAKGKRGTGDRVERAKQRIDKAVGRLTQLKEKRLSASRKAENAIDRAADNFAAKGLDVSKLRSDDAELKSKVEAAAGECDAVIGELNKAKSLASADSAEQFRSAVKSAMGNARDLRSDVKDIRTFIKTVVRPDIQALRSQAGRGA